MKKTSVFLSLLIFFIFVAIFWNGFSNMETNQDQEDIQRVQESIKKGVLECYAVEGKYPESLSYLEKNYGVYVNEERYLIHYNYQGANLYPDYTIYVKGETE